MSEIEEWHERSRSAASRRSIQKTSGYWNDIQMRCHDVLNPSFLMLAGEADEGVRPMCEVIETKDA
jgi:hypothetical protein